MSLGVVIMFFPLFLVLFKFYLEPKIKKNMLQKKWDSEWGEREFLLYDKYLSKHISYYNNLSLAGKKKFVQRVYDFIRDVIFFGKGGEVITREKQIIIAAAAIQLTFGYKEYLFYSFRYVFIYPKAFFSKVYDGYLKGGTYPIGAVAFSWEDFKHGYRVDNDKINLGLHEMAHTLLLQVSDDKFESYIDNWFTVSRKEFLNIKEGNSAMFRSYAGTNRYEFLSVAVECFFEAPTEFEKRLPEIYESMKVLLNQDPQNNENDYVLDPNATNTLRDFANHENL